MVSRALIEKDLKQAMKDRALLKVAVLRMVISALRNVEIEKKAELSETDVVKVLTHEAKKRKESIEIFNKAKRQELADKESQELEIIESYLPKQMSKEEIQEFIQNLDELKTMKGDFGQAMKLVMAKLKGKADGKMVAEALKDVL